METSHNLDRKDRRRARRRSGHVFGLIRKWDSPIESSDNVDIEEVSENGIRIHSATRLRERDSVILTIPGQPEPLGAQVVWSHVDGPIASLEKHAVDDGWMAGCKVNWASREEARRVRKLIPSGAGLGEWLFQAAPTVGRVLLVAGILSVVVLGYMVLARLIGGNAMILIR